MSRAWKAAKTSVLSSGKSFQSNCLVPSGRESPSSATHPKRQDDAKSPGRLCAQQDSAASGHHRGSFSVHRHPSSAQRVGLRRVGSIALARLQEARLTRPRPLVNLTFCLELGLFDEMFTFGAAHRSSAVSSRIKKKFSFFVKKVSPFRRLLLLCLDESRFTPSSESS